MDAKKQIFILIGCLLFAATVNSAKPSTCYGSTSSGSIVNAVTLPQKGDNFQVFSQLAWHLGRTYVHTDVHSVVLKSYAQLHTKLPENKFVYGETGWSSGGPFQPHKTHQNGLSVDFMVPTFKENKVSVTFPMSLSNKWGYEVDFDATGKFAEFNIDFEAMAWHLKLLFEQSRALGFDIERVFFDPKLQPLLFDTKNGPYIQAHINFNKNQAWVRHDEHYHVDFKVPCD